MAEFSYSAIDQIQTPGGNVSVNTGSGDYFFTDPSRCTGLGEVEVRGQDDEKGQTDGLLLHPRYLGGQRINLLLIAIINSASTDPGYATARDALLVDARTKLKAMINADGTLHFAGGQTITCRARILGPPTSEGALGPSVKSILVGLVSATPPP